MSTASNTDNKRVLAIMPHPDDIEILCAGTLIRLREEAGYEIHIATMTAGDKGSAVLSRTEIADIRREEARKAAEILGAVSYRCLEFQDLEITFDNESRSIVAGLCRDINPAIVFTTPPLDYMFDHEITSQLVRDAVFNAGVPNYGAKGDSPATSSTPHLYYSDAIEGVDLFGQPSRVSCRVDISSTIEQKADALKAHDSQRSWLQKQHGMDNYIESMKKWSAVRGSEIGVAFGEAFSQHLGHPYPHDNILETLLKGVVNA
jgi:LmbE family N-acetylglucosaminyl deacetylase